MKIVTVTVTSDISIEELNENKKIFLKRINICYLLFKIKKYNKRLNN